jgi:hypothetical protein
MNSMQGQFRVFPLQGFRWPSGRHREASALHPPPAAFEIRLGLTFEVGNDDLDYYRALGLQLASGRRIVLNRYERGDGCTHIWSDFADDPTAARLETVEALGLTERDVAWIPERDPDSMPEKRPESGAA